MIGSYERDDNTLLVLKTIDNDIFGAFVSANLLPEFEYKGDTNSFVFKVVKGKV
jgi:hypothetical protein